MGESEQFRIDSGVRQGCIMSPWLFKVYKDAVMKEMKMWIGRMVRVKITCLFYADDLVLCGESKEDLRVIVVQFVELCRRRGLKVNAGKSKVGQ